MEIRPLMVGGRQKVRKKFNPKWEYGVGVEMKLRTDKKAIEFLHKSAKEFLPKGTPYELRMQDFSDGSIDFGRGECKEFPIRACWYYNPRRSTTEKFSTKRWKLSISIGVYIRGLFFS